ncbi:MAG: thioesterase family protein [Deltaproteobacteria bacterium]
MRRHVHRFRPIYGDTDMMGVVYYANYFRFFEAGRTEFLRAAGFEYRMFEDRGYGLPVASASAKYHAPSKYDDPLALTIEIAEVRYGSLRITYRLVRESDDTLIATGETMHACVGPSGRVVRIPDDFRSKLEPDDEDDVQGQ